MKLILVPCWEGGEDRTCPGSTSDVYTMHANKAPIFLFQGLKSGETSIDKARQCRWLKTADGRIQMLAL